MHTTLIAILISLSSTISPAHQDPACSAPAYHQFDFWIGDWDTYDMADPDSIVARNHVTRMVGGCALREVYEQNDGLRGESFSAWDAGRGVWHQSWVTNRGTMLLLDGGMKDGKMVLTATEHYEDGSTSLLRGIWWKEGRNVREKAERSRDGGKTWTTAFDIVFRPHVDSGNGRST
jgi:hypothetical protein